MRAAFFQRNGPPEVLQVGELPCPLIGDADVLVRVYASSVNPVDCYVRRGGLRRYAAVPFPIIPGIDVSGVVVETGNEVRGLRGGDEVFGYIPRAGGACAEFVACNFLWLAHKPRRLSHTEAAVLPCVGLTALQALRDKAQLKSGQSVLIVGASGGVGTMAVQIAREMGLEVVAVCSQRNAGLVRELGAGRTIDYRTEEVLSFPYRFDAIFDCVGTHPFWSYRELLKRGGRHVGISCSPAARLSSLLSQLTPGKTSHQFHVRASSKDLEQLACWCEGDRLHPVLTRIYPLADIAEAHRQCETRRTVGKLAIAVA